MEFIPFMSKSIAILAVALWIFTADAFARDDIAGPVEAQILRVIDGDTLLVEARPWPQQRMEVYVRIRGIDAPELKSKCQSLREAGAEARKALQDLAATSTTIRLTRISGDKYFGRIVAGVALMNGQDVAASMQVSGLVRAYDGGRKSSEYCNG